MSSKSPDFFFFIYAMYELSMLPFS